MSLPRLNIKFQQMMGRTRILSRGAQLAIFILAGVGAFLLRFEFIIPPVHLRHLFFGVAAWAVVKSVVFHLHRLDRGWWRFVSTNDLVRIASANLVGSIAGGLVIYFFGRPGFPRSLYLLDAMLCFGATAGIRLAVRLVAEATANADPSGVGGGDCPASTIFPYQRQLFFPIDDNYKLGKTAHLPYTGADRSRG